ncbi:Glucan endo-1,6-beta-glucosidase B [Psilocybe cubensis]|uniref:Glucan endo-1,6-beta-glucosidase B n=1 Tax=Psilocybe cubensis TaxID=181762 RepID=A0ACB8GV79_PSICU|nr:Glucan endo-1,6-beta-glucosidase B [Psilocybe cubensis]KAH9479277.1 Glucan endo-1,6-beta-glucosidase B [Psilocybe cubensis]
MVWSALSGSTALPAEHYFLTCAVEELGESKLVAMHTTIFYSLSFLALGVLAALPGLPDKIYGVNLGSWLVLEPWMLPAEWIAMGGQQCDDCSQCIASEFAFAEAYPDTVDTIFDGHWESWFNQPDVDQLVDAGINTVRIPLGYWIVEPLVNRTSEFYPKGGILQLKRGLKQLKASGIAAILDHHALPGVASPGQMFAGRCTNDVEFYTPYNYHRALIWTAVMTVLSHIDPDFGTVAGIEAMNEPIMDANQTPGLGGFQTNFVQVVRAVELALGIPVQGIPPFSGFSSAVNVASSLSSVAKLSSIFNSEVQQVLRDAAPILVQVSTQLRLDITLATLSSLLSKRRSLVTSFMDINWQHNTPANPADAAIGPQGYDNHLYYSLHGVADANEDAYLTSVCNLERIQADAALGNTPLWFGEWALSTQFSASDTFLRKWADAQKFSYGKGAGWIFWNFKIEKSDLAGDTARQWSYMEGLRLGYLTQDPSKFNDPHVCDPYLNVTSV